MPVRPSTPEHTCSSVPLSSTSEVLIKTKKLREESHLCWSQTSFLPIVSWTMQQEELPQRLHCIKQSRDDLESIGGGRRLCANPIPFYMRDLHPPVLGILAPVPMWQTYMLLAFVSAFVDWGTPQLMGSWVTFQFEGVPNNSFSTCQYLSLTQLLQTFLWCTETEIDKSRAIEPLYILHACTSS